MRTSYIVVFAFITIMCIIPSSGCTKATTATSETAPGAPQVDQAKQFVTKLKTMPPGQRQAYAAQHQDLVNVVNRSGDASLRSEFMQTMMQQPK